MARLVYRDVDTGNEETLELDPSAPPVSIGRTDEVTVRIRNGSVSRRHALIWFADGAWQVKDQNSSNGTTVNDQRLSAAVPLRGGDAIKVGEVEMWFHDDPPAARVKATRARTVEEPAREPVREPVREPARETTRNPTPREDRGRQARAVAEEAPAPAPVAVATVVAAELPRGGTASVPKFDRGKRPHIKPMSDSGTDLPAVVDLPRRTAVAAAVSVPDPAEERPATRSRSRVQRMSLRDAAGVEADVSNLQDELSRAAERASRAEAERDELREKAAARAGNEAVELARQLKQVEHDRARLDADLTEQRQINAELSAQMRDLEQRNVRYSVELDSVTEKYVKVKDQHHHQRQRLEEAREQITDFEERIADLERELQKAHNEIDSLAQASREATQAVTELKIRVSQKDRQIEELQHQVDLLQFELRASREENEALQASFNRDGGEINQLEKKMNMLREVISEKENAITQLRRDLEEKDREIIQVRMGVGIKDLEDERRKLLEDFYIKNREVGELRDKVAALTRERDGAQGQVTELEERAAELEAELAARSLMPTDISDHPDFKERVRHVSRLDEELQAVRVELQRAEARLAEFPPDEHRRLTTDLALARKQLEDAKERLTRAQQEVHEQALSSEQLEGFRGNLVGRYELLQENFISLRSNVSLFRAYVRDIQKAVVPLHKLPKASGPDEVREALEAADVDGAVASFEDLVRVVEDEADLMKRELVNFRNSLES